LALSVYIRSASHCRPFSFPALQHAPRGFNNALEVKLAVLYMEQDLLNPEGEGCAMGCHIENGLELERA
jgi:hypothetical protein